MADEHDDTFDPATGLTSGDLRSAALTVCSYATDIEDARYLLEALGLAETLRAHANRRLGAAATVG